MPIPHPTEFYTAHAVIMGDPRHPHGVWGDLSDGPADWTELREKIIDVFRDEAPTLETLRVWHHTADAPPREVTEDVIAVLSDMWPDEEYEVMPAYMERAERLAAQ